MAKNNYPQGALDSIEPDTNKLIISSLKHLHDLGVPQTDLEVSDRVDMYFAYCQQSGLRCGIESLALALHVSRQTIYNWSLGINCSVERMNTIQSAKQYIASYLEQITLQNKINPVSSVFLFKNWLSYKSEISLEENLVNHTTHTEQLKASQLPRLDLPNEP
jgi:hypothetical protein